MKLVQKLVGLYIPVQKLNCLGFESFVDVLNLHERVFGMFKRKESLDISPLITMALFFLNMFIFRGLSL